ncbi:glycosyl hydrolase family 18 protein [Paenibacillus glycinis]|uniref:Glycoside hydrolase n=1 Tax=Paenibacillus glycinis TaxID=2697035 RepID=A0ABW9XM74_9BACL|nr:glycosyl hydrolase family 18 protein [Paenibacillus glycinis]NBD23519.1 glycoside hydrolase [Paenibacillus glycinis]
MPNRIKWTATLAVVLAFQAGLTTFGLSEAHAASGTANYRVYQNDKAIRDFAASSSAISYAKSFAYAHVEKITGRAWVWDNWPRYKVYENGVSSPGREFKTLQEAEQFAKKTRFAQIRDLEAPGFVESVFPNFRMYQGDKSLAAWSFATLADAKQAAKSFAGVHIMDLSSNQWVWDNITDAQEAAQRQTTPKYSVLKDGAPIGGKSYGFLLDAIRASAGMAGSTVVNTLTNQVVHSNIPAFAVTQSGKALGSYFSIYSAIAYAKTLSGATVAKDGATWWTNMPYLTVSQGDKPLKSFHTRKSAVQYAAQFKDAVVKTADGRSVWSNAKKLLYLGWNGTSSTATVLDQLGRTQGLDIDSPSWFELADASGTISDGSDPALVEALRPTGIKLTPLVSNQFDSKLTSAFLRSAAAKSRFIANLVAKLSALRVAGVNVDFEGLAGGDRALYTEFIRSLTSAAHKAGLSVSVDLPRGDVLWDAQTAYDQQALAGIVDMIMMMAYDQHWEGGDDAGSVAELAWVEEGVKQFLSYGIPRGKLMLGIPFYAREWRIDGSGKLIDSQALIMRNLSDLIQTTGAKGVFDSVSGQMKYTYGGHDGYTHVFWAETPETVKARLAIAKKYDLAGVAAWRLGFEQADLWNAMLLQK